MKTVSYTLNCCFIIYLYIIKYAHVNVTLVIDLQRLRSTFCIELVTLKHALHCFVHVLLSSSALAKQWKQCKAVQAHIAICDNQPFCISLLFSYSFSFLLRVSVFVFCLQCKQSKGRADRGRVVLVCIFNTYYRRHLIDWQFENKTRQCAQAANRLIMRFNWGKTPAEAAVERSGRGSDREQWQQVATDSKARGSNYSGSGGT